MKVKVRLGLFIVLMMTLCNLNTIHAQNLYSGSCGDNVTWSLDDEGTLEISGEGDMRGYSGGLFSWPGGPWKNYSVQRVVINSGVTGVGAFSFYMMNQCCVSIAEGVTYIGSGAFDGTTLSSIIIPKSVTSIGSYAFFCTNVNQVYYSGTEDQWNNIEIGDYNSDLLSANITFNSTKKSLYDDKKGDIFNDGILIYKIVKINGSKGTAEVYGLYDSAKTSITIPKNVTYHEVKYTIKSIGKKAFSGTNIKKVSFGKALTTIKDKAFYNCKSIKKIYLPDNIKTLGKDCFSGCSKLKTFTITSLNTEVGNNAFKNVHKKITICVPYSKLSSYKKSLVKKGLPKTATVTFKKISINDDNSKYDYVSSYMYSGKTLEPTVNVYYVDDNSCTMLKQDKDYTIEYKNNKNVGTGTISISYKGQYAGTKKLTFQIKKKQKYPQIEHDVEFISQYAEMDGMRQGCGLASIAVLELWRYKTYNDAATNYIGSWIDSNFDNPYHSFTRNMYEKNGNSQSVVWNKLFGKRFTTGCSNTLYEKGSLSSGMAELLYENLKEGPVLVWRSNGKSGSEKRVHFSVIYGYKGSEDNIDIEDFLVQEVSDKYSASYYNISTEKYRLTLDKWIEKDDCKSYAIRFGYYLDLQ